MNDKYLQTLEYFKILEQLAEHTSFSAGRDLALALRPSTNWEEVRDRQQQTAEAKHMLSLRPGLSVGGAHDVRPLLRTAQIDVALEPNDLLDIQSTLTGARKLKRVIVDDAAQFPMLAAIAERIEECSHLVNEISRCISDRGEVLDSASPALQRIRRELISARDRLLDRLNAMINAGGGSMFQESIVTQRNGRYVIPLKAEFKGRIPGIVHDQSASGATLFIEPIATVELGNQWRQLQLEEQQEVTRILKALTLQVREQASQIRATVEALAELDLMFAKAEYAFAIKAIAPELLPANPGTSTEDRAPYPEYIRLVRARHPVLPTDTVVPIDVRLGGAFAILVITGPNTGGKTVALKTVGLLVAMAQAGLQIPAAEGTALAVFTGLNADIGDEQSIEQSLSTFSSHMHNIVSILAEADEGSLVLLDELGAGTDPLEGSALARAILSELLRRRVPAMITTHYTELKLFAQAIDGLENASVEFDVQRLMPTFKLSIGLPGRSNAFAIAQRLGLPEAIISEARSLIPSREQEADRVLAGIRRSQEELTRASKAAQSALAAARRKEEEAQRRLREAEQERRALLAEARDLVEAAQDEWRRMRRTIEKEEATRDWLEEAGKRLQELEKKQEAIQPMSNAVERESVAAAQQLAVGDSVWVSSLNQVGQVLSLSGANAEVQVGAFRAKVPVLELEKRAGAQVQDTAVRVEMASRPIPRTEIDLRGARVEEAMSQIDKYLDDACLASLPFVRIIHGKGTGALRQAIRELLKTHPLVESFRTGEINEGGDGVTVVTLVPSH